MEFLVHFSVSQITSNLILLTPPTRSCSLSKRVGTETLFLDSDEVSDTEHGPRATQTTQRAQDLTMDVLDPGGRQLLSHSPSDLDRVHRYDLMNNSDI